MDLPHFVLCKTFLLIALYKGFQILSIPTPMKLAALEDLWWPFRNFA